MRDWKYIDHYLNILAGDIYEQPEDKGHTALAQSVIDLWMSRLTTCKSVLDVGAGQGFCEAMFKRWNVEYEGIALGMDVVKAQTIGRKVNKMDYHFLEYEDDSFDLIFARHSLEHSPMPLLALMEWERVSKSWLGLVMPAPEHYTYRGLNHYSVMNDEQLLGLTDRAGWKVIWFEYKPTIEEPQEYWVMLEKKTI